MAGVAGGYLRLAPLLTPPANINALPHRPADQPHTDNALDALVIASQLASSATQTAHDATTPKEISTTPGLVSSHPAGLHPLHVCSVLHAEMLGFASLVTDRLSSGGRSRIALAGFPRAIRWDMMHPCHTCARCRLGLRREWRCPFVYRRPGATGKALGRSLGLGKLPAKVSKATTVSYRCTRAGCQYVAAHRRYLNEVSPHPSPTYTLRCP
jgi:hypothetical protein